MRGHGQRKVADKQPLTDAQLLRLRKHARSLIAAPSPSLLATHVRTVSSANRAGDAEALRGALLDLVAVALHWADELQPSGAEGQLRALKAPLSAP
jgi:hypothetical protein